MLKEQSIPYYGVKEAVFPFNMFPEVDPLLGPEMRSTGEVLGLSTYYGERPGEKLYEELLMKTEELDKTSNDMIFIERDKGLPREEVERKLDLVRQAIETEEQSAVLEVIRKTVPTYHDPAEINGKADQARETAAANE